MKDPVSTERFLTREIQIGKRIIGGESPVLVQSMTTTDTMDIDATLRQIKSLQEVNCPIIRITAPTVKDAEALQEIRNKMNEAGIDIPIVADIHFLPKAADIAADFVEKVRINPGNFADRKMFKVREYSDDEYETELKRIREKFSPLVKKLKKLNRALRIGTNHGSLSDRIMNRYGDSPLGMVESAFEYAEICRELDFHNFCFSMKASNVSVMIEAYRLLVDKQKERGWNYPIHLGVTEAGDGEDARIKSAIGIGTLLAEGIGDTIRVSLTEAPMNEVPVAQALADRFPKNRTPVKRGLSLSPTTKNELGLPKVWLKYSGENNFLASIHESQLRPDVFYFDKSPDNPAEMKSMLRTALGVPELEIAAPQDKAGVDYVLGRDVYFMDSLEEVKDSQNIDPSQVVLRRSLTTQGSELDQILEACEHLGSPFIESNWLGISVEGLKASQNLRLAYGILQATRRRMSKTEYIACPSCGRTLFDLEETTARIKAVTNHLKGVKIAVMGCIVNGPGEMADADFGYVGGAPGRVNLYVEKECVERNIPSAEAPQRLVELIKKHNRWVEPEPTPNRAVS